MTPKNECVCMCVCVTMCAYIFSYICAVRDGKGKLFPATDSNHALFVFWFPRGAIKKGRPKESESNLWNYERKRKMAGHNKVS